ncbi:MAG: hypothetical protein M0R22_11745, partial [Dehalococcoidia bacterium]|nr:hypothetical protein [Dehalococcoidia bacterium]
MIYDYIAIAWAWALAHPEICIPVLVYIAWNIIPRQPPADRRLFALWAVAERLMITQWNRWGGFKPLGIVSPDPATWAEEAPTR